MTEKAKMTIEDIETTINFGYDTGSEAEVYTTDKLVMKRFEKFCREHPDCGRLYAEDKYSMTFRVIPRCASLYPRAPRKVNLTDAQRNALRDRMNAIRNK